MPIRVVFLAAECEPWAKTGGLADVVDALARAVGRLDGVVDEVDVFLPGYRGVPVPEGCRPGRALSVADPLAPSGRTEVHVVDVPADGYRLRLIDHPPAFDRDGIYGEGRDDYPDNAWRYGLFCRAALEALRVDGRRVDVLHLHDWHAVPAVVQRDRWYADDPVIGPAAVLLTLHTIAYHGWTPREQLGQLGLAPGDGVVAGDAAGIDLLWAGIERAELVNTVSPGFAADALTPEHGMGLDGVLRSRGDRFFGILNGLDTDAWNPATDGDLARRYSREDRAGKAACRTDLLERIGFAPEDPGPVLAMVGRLARQKGFDLVTEAAPDLLARGARLVVLGTGDAGLLDGLRELAAARPDRLALIERFDRVLARRIYAGADLFLMPSRFEPCGLAQLIALRYGTPPIVRRTGGLRDTVLDEYAFPGRGTGFVFDHPTAAGLLWACDQALATFDAGGARWSGLVDRGMALDFSWRASSARYVDAYHRAAAIRRAER